MENMIEITLQIDLCQIIILFYNYNGEYSNNDKYLPNVEIFNENTWRKPEIVKDFHILTKTLQELEYWEPVNINQFCPELRK